MRAWGTYRRFAAWLALLLLVACAHHRGPAPTTAAPKGLLKLHIVHTNDMHGQVRAVKAMWMKTDEPPMAGGIQAVAGYVRKVRESMGPSEAMLLLDAGDVFQGTPEGDLSEGRVLVEFMNYLQYDAVAIGNHDFDFGEEVLASLVGQSRAPWLAANLLRLPDRTAHPHATPFVVKDVGGIKVGIVGLAPGNLKSLCMPSSVERVEATDEEKAALEAMARARERGAEVMLLLTHIGEENDKKLAARLPDLDAILGGHSHTGIRSTWIAEETGTLVAQGYGKTADISHVELDIDLETRKVVAKRSKLVELFAADYAEDKELAALISPHTNEIEKKMSEVIGESPAPLTRSSGYLSSALGNILVDEMRRAVGADVAMHNKTGMRSDLDAGKLTLRDAYRVCPFGNTITTVMLSGAELVQAFEYMLSDRYYALELSGVELRADLSKAKGSRVLSLLVGGAAVDAERIYSVVTNSFLAVGGDGHAVLGAAEERKPDERTLRSLFLGHLRAHRPLELDEKSRVILATAD